MKACEMTLDYIKNAIKKNNFGATNFEDEDTGAIVVVEPCSYFEGITDFSQIDFYSMRCNMVDGMCGSSDIEKIAKTIQNIAGEIADSEKDKVELREYYEKYLTPEKRAENEEVWQGHFDFYSDWHKDVYGYRPRF